MAEPDAAPASTPLAAAKTIVKTTVTAGAAAGTAGGAMDIIEGCLVDISTWCGFTFDHPASWAGALVGLAAYYLHKQATKGTTS